jgi:transcriptional regulator with XRE-family HTH domain
VTARQQEVPAIFGQRIQSERERNGWSMRDLSTKAGVSQSTIFRIEKGHDAALSSAIAIAAVLRLSLDALLAEPACAQCNDSPPAGFICATCDREGAL